MTVLFPVAGTALLILTIPFIGRVILGPTIFDRVQALNGAGSLIPGIIVIVGVMYGRVEMFVDIAIAMYVLNLFTTLLIARYVRDRAERR
jgi:multicomponent Na+:H+ antiporter subunit F